MNIETMIYAYLAICLAMILFNCACIIAFKFKDNELEPRENRFKRIVTEEITALRSGQSVSSEHREFLRKKLLFIGNLIALDETLQQLREEEPEVVSRYIREIQLVFTLLTAYNYYSNPMKKAYFAFFIAKYNVLLEKQSSALMAYIMNLLEQPSIYCRENALQAIYSTGNCKDALNALRIVDENGFFHHEKLLTDGLLLFPGNKEELIQLLWEKFDSFSVHMQLVILNYIRFSGSVMQDEILMLLKDEKCDDEIRFSCIRYFQRHPDERAYPMLLSFLDETSKLRWEYAAISATALAAYPGKKTVDALKRVMTSPNWYIRFNASKSLESFHLKQEELLDIMNSEDRYAREILRYQLDIQKAREKGGSEKKNV